MKHRKSFRRALTVVAVAGTLGVIGAPPASALYYADVTQASDGPKKSCEWGKGSGDWYLHGMKYYNSANRTWYVCNDGQV
jgi:hypothetical protein